MTRCSCLCTFSILAGAALAALPPILHAQIINRRPLNGASLGGLSTGAVTNIPFVAKTEDAAYVEIVSAVRRGAPSLLERVLKNYSHSPRFLNEHLNYYETPVIFHAIAEMKIEHCDLLIHYGSIVDIQLPDTQFRKFQKVAARKIDAKQTIKGSCTPFAYACHLPVISGSQKRDAMAVMKMLLDSGADCNLPGFEGKPPVQILGEQDRIDELKMVLSYKKVEFNSPVLEEYMRTHKEDEAVRILKAYMVEQEAEAAEKAVAAVKSAKKPPFAGNPTLSFDKAVLTGNTSEILKHLGAMKDVDDPLPGDGNAFRQTPLIRTVVLERPAAVRLVLDAGADPNLPDETTCNPLVYAEMKRLDEIVSMLKAVGAKLPVCADMETAAKQDRPDEIERLYKEAVARKVKTAPLVAQAMIAAVGLERERAFAQCIKLGGNPNQIKVNKQIPLVFHLIDKKLVAFLLACGNASTPLDLKVKHPLVKLTPMLYAASGTKTSPEVIRALVKLGASPNSKGTKNKTALMYAAEAGNDAVVQALLKAGADPNAVDADGRTYRDYDN
ncbi:MAG: ankyrin repeat domain-containing protein [Lentisphaeria bacterium]|nr:ankyrin repeat domain-containing protein [Lentisphaeria bacterium]